MTEKYNYQAEKSVIFKEENQKNFLKVRDTVRHHIKTSGCVSMEVAIHGICGSKLTAMAYVDRLVELGEIKEFPTLVKVPNKDRIFI
jgi:hypothetical protein